MAWGVTFLKILVKKLDKQSKKVKLSINSFNYMNKLKRVKKTRSKNALFDPYTNGISSYDLAYLSSKRVFKNKTIHLRSDYKKKKLAA